MAKAVHENSSDGEGRRLGDQMGLDTPVVLAVNAASQMLQYLVILQCRNEGVKLATWEVRSQG